MDNTNVPTTLLHVESLGLCKEFGLTKRKRGKAWRTLSRKVRSAEPWCRICREQGRERGATETHHIVPVAVNPKLMFVRSNLMPVCRECHVELHRNPTAPVA